MSETRQCVKWEVKGHGLKTVLAGRCSLFEAKSDENLEARILRLGLTEGLRTAFPKTDPICYGWFIESPLSREQMELMSLIVVDLMALPFDYDYGVREFQAALDLCIKANLDLHVEYTPPGHVDFGSHTIHCHCPRCKARTPVPPWKPPFPEEATECLVCGFTYSPASTRSRQRAFAFTTVQCAQCYRSISGDLFSAEDLLRIEHYLSYRSAEAELRTVILVSEFYSRGTLAIPNKAMFQERNDFIDEFIRQSLPGTLSQQDLVILEYLKWHIFEVESRNKFLREQLGRKTLYFDDQVVFCPECRGALF